MKGELFAKYIWLIQTFIKAGDTGLDLEQVGRRWRLHFGTDYPRRSFANHREAIEEIFGIRIDCDRSTNRYLIRASADVSDGDAQAAWLVNTFTVNHLLALGKERLTGRVAVENIPSGQRWLTLLMEAMTDNHLVRITYQKYSAEAGETLHVRPYAVKEAEKRWYLVGYCQERQAMRVYGLDRIKEMEVLQQDFAMPERFDVDELFAESYGVYLPEGLSPERIVFCTSEREARFLRDLPLHPSQRELPQVGKGPRPVRFALRTRVNDSLIMRLCSYGDRLEVLAPDSLREAVAREHRRAMALYGPAQ